MAVAAEAEASGLHRIEVTVPAVVKAAAVVTLAAVPNVVARSLTVPALGEVCKDRNTLALDALGI